jgi:hypothetical protein
LHDFHKKDKCIVLLTFEDQLVDIVSQLLTANLVNGRRNRLIPEPYDIPRFFITNNDLYSQLNGAFIYVALFQDLYIGLLLALKTLKSKVSAYGTGMS